MKTKPNELCQSCGMPMKKDPQGGGTHADGMKSEKYCSYCYRSGLFTRPDFTVQEMQKLCVDNMVERRIPRFIANYLVKDIPRLERWRIVRLI